VTDAGIKDGKLFRCVCRAGNSWGKRMREKVVWHVVKENAARLGLPAKIRDYLLSAGNDDYGEKYIFSLSTAQIQFHIAAFEVSQMPVS
jgi:hypothetical protein